MAVNNAAGTCYEDAWRFLIKEEEGELIHGTVESLGRRIGHAWVELPTGFIWEPETRQFLKKADFEAIAKPQEEARYSVTEAAIMLARVGKHGPWTEEERQMLKGSNPGEKKGLPDDEPEEIKLSGKMIEIPLKEGKVVVTVKCPLCDDVLEVPDYDSVTRSDILSGHIATKHISRIRPATPGEGPPLPRGLGIKWPWRKS